MRTARHGAAVLALAAAYWASAELGIRLAAANQIVTAVWPPTGIALLALVLGGRKLWPGIAAGAFLAEIAAGVPVVFAVGMAAGTTIALVIAASVLERLRVTGVMERVRDVLVFVGVVAASMVISATSGTVLLGLADIAADRSPALTWLIWWVGDAMGAVLIVPVGLALARGGRRRFHRPLETLVLLAGTALLTVVLWHYPFPVRHLVIPLAILGALRLGPRGAALITFGAATAAIATAAMTPRVEDYLLLQSLNASIALITLTLSAVMNERNEKTWQLEAIATDLEMRIAERTAALGAAHRNLAQAQRLAHLGSFHWDAKQDVVRWSDELYQIHHMDPACDPPTMDEYMALVAAEDRERVREAVIRAGREGRPVDHEYPMTLADGSRIWVHAYFEPLVDAHGNLVGLQGASQDITARRSAEEAHRMAEEREASERNRIEEALRTALDREREATAHLRRLDETKNAILNAVSHELRTPLTAIQGFAELLQMPEIRDNEEMFGDLVRRIDGSSRRLGRLLQDLLDLSRLEHGVGEPVRETRKIEELIQTALLDLDLSEHPITVEEAAGTCTVDPIHFERIVQNLVGNALKYTPPGTPIHVAAHAESDGGVTIAIEDEGPGVPEDKRTMIFEPFARVSNGPYTQGAGVGLALVDRFAKIHGGRAWLDERSGGGAAFRVHLPGGTATCDKNPVAAA